MAIEMVSNGATLSCMLGSMSSKLMVLTPHGAGLKGQNHAVISDNVANKNIMPFGLCKKTNPPIPCSPIICMNWVNGKMDMKINNEMALISICILPCMQGGIIKIEKSGQE